MKVLYTCFVLALLALNFTACSGGSGDLLSPVGSKPYVYFVGNSITYVHDIPGRLDRIIKANRAYPEDYSTIASTAAGGSTLSRHLEGQSGEQSALYKAFRFSKAPRYLVLQEQSCGPHLNRTENVIPHYQALASYWGAEIILYQTWHTDCALSNGTRYSDYVPLEQRDSVRLYKGLANDFNLAMAPIGEVWQALKTSDENLLLTPAGDPVHQNELGASVNAVTFFYTLYPDSEKIAGILAQTGLMITSEQDDAYNEIIYNTVRNHPNTALKGADSASEINLQNPTGQLDWGLRSMGLEERKLQIWKLPRSPGGDLLLEVSCRVGIVSRCSMFYSFNTDSFAYSFFRSRNRVNGTLQPLAIERLGHPALDRGRLIRIPGNLQADEDNYLIFMSGRGAIPASVTLNVGTDRTPQVLPTNLRVRFSNDLRAEITWRTPVIRNDSWKFVVSTENNDDSAFEDRSDFTAALSGEEQRLSLGILRQNTNYTFKARFQALDNNIVGQEASLSLRSPSDMVPVAELPNVSATSISSNQIRLSWDEPHEDVWEIEISYRPQSSTEDPITRTIYSIYYSSWPLRNLQANTAYEVTIKTIKYSGRESAGQTYTYTTSNAE